MHLTSDEKLVASAMAGLKRPHQHESTSVLSGNHAVKDLESSAQISSSPTSKRMKESIPDLSSGIEATASHGTNMATTCYPSKTVTTTSAVIRTTTTVTTTTNNHDNALAKQSHQPLCNMTSHAPQELPPIACREEQISPSAFASLEAMTITADSPPATLNNTTNKDNDDLETDNATASGPRDLLPSPYFYYRDFSQTPDDDPLTPLTPLARVPNFPAKMHAILSREDLADVVAWMPHGRSWKVLNSRQFEIRVIPAYFEHSKFSSFIRQANGWGFRRITRGKDRNSYYHELFLRGLPHLCKKMRRPGVSKKLTVDVGHEPDLYQISQEFPVPEKTENVDSIMLPHTLLGGPKARMPVAMGTAYMVSSQNGKDANGASQNPALLSAWHAARNMQNTAGGQSNSLSGPFQSPSSGVGAWPTVEQLQMLQKPSALQGIHLPLNASKPPPCASQPSQAAPSLKEGNFTDNSNSIPILPRPYGFASYQTPAASLVEQHNQHQPARLHIPPSNQMQQPTVNNNPRATVFQQALSVAAAAMGSEPTSQFAAGFAAAAALANPHFQRAFHQALANASYTPTNVAPASSTSGAQPSVVYNEERLQENTGV